MHFAITAPRSYLSLAPIDREYIVCPSGLANGPTESDMKITLRHSHSRPSLSVTLGRDESRRLEVHRDGGGCSPSQNAEWQEIHSRIRDRAAIDGVTAYTVYAAKRYGGHIITDVDMLDQ